MKCAVVVGPSEWSDVKLCVRQPRRMGRYMIFDVACMRCGAEALIQTPSMYMPYAPLRDDHGNISFDLSLFENKGSIEFYAFLDDMMTRIRGRIIALYAAELDGFVWLPVIRQEEGGYARRIRASSAEDDVVAFDSQGTRIQLARVRRDHRVHALLKPRHVCVDQLTRTVRLKIEMIQIQSMDVSAPRDCCIVAPAAAAAPTSIYRKMMKNGVGKDAVAHKMRLDGCSEHDIAALIYGINKIHPAPPPPPPPLPKGPLLLLSAIKGASIANLKKGKDIVKKPSTPGVSPPSLAEILAARHNLRALKKTQH